MSFKDAVKSSKSVTLETTPSRSIRRRTKQNMDSYRFDRTSCSVRCDPISPDAPAIRQWLRVNVYDSDFNAVIRPAHPTDRYRAVTD